MAGKKKASSKLLLVLPIIGLIIGFGLLFSLVAIDMYIQHQANEVISTMTDVADDMDNPERLEQLSQAQSYNNVLAGKASDIAADELWAYDDQLTYEQRPYMGWIEIPKIDVRMAIYHGVEEVALAAGVGHLPGTSLPVGGESTHTVLPGHSGMTTARMFDDLKQLEIGDKFCLHILSENLAYEVYDIEVVLPDETDSLVIQDGEDLCTLITCTPYGVNDHRLLVHAKRCAYDPKDFESGGIDASNYVNRRTLPLLVAVGIAGIGVVICIVRKKRKKKKVLSS